MVGTHSQARDLSRWDTWVTVAEDHDDSAARGKIRAERRIVSGCCILAAQPFIAMNGGADLLRAFNFFFVYVHFGVRTQFVPVVIEHRPTIQRPGAHNIGSKAASGDS